MRWWGVQNVVYYYRLKIILYNKFKQTCTVVTTITKKPPKNHPEKVRKGTWPYFLGYPLNPPILPKFKSYIKIQVTPE